MKQIINQKIILVISLICLLFSSCKKEENTDGVSTDDPFIDTLSVNQTFSYSGLINAQAERTIQIFGKDITVKLNNASDKKYVRIKAEDDDENLIYFQKIDELQVNGTTVEFLPMIPFGNYIEIISSSWIYEDEYFDEGYVFYNDKSPFPGESFGINGKDDQYMAFRIPMNGAFNYGWLKINLSADANILVIKEAAICRAANVKIKTGAK